MKKKLAVIFGGRAAEHDVSIVTGIQLIENSDKSKYDIVPIYITREGEWYTGDKLKSIEFIKKFDKNDKSLTAAYLSPVPGIGGLISMGPVGGLFAKAQKIIEVDVVIPAMHGLNGEDGTLQGLLELSDIPYASAGVLGSSAGMDKILMKSTFRGADIPVLESEYFTRDEWEKNQSKTLATLEKTLPYPMFVKPANLGSSIGISRADDREGLIKAIDIAAQYDRRIIVERAVTSIMEINCSCMGYGDSITASVCEQPVSWKEFLTFDEKYLRSNTSKGMQSLARKIPAPISSELTQEIQAMSIKIFKLLDCKGVVRIDYIIDSAQNKLYANEINTIPGSFAFYLWEPLGISFSKLIDTLVDDAIRANQDKRKSIFAFDSDILKKVNIGCTKGAKGPKRVK